MSVALTVIVFFCCAESLIVPGLRCRSRPPSMSDSSHALCSSVYARRSSRATPHLRAHQPSLNVCSSRLAYPCRRASPERVLLSKVKRGTLRDSPQYILPVALPPSAAFMNHQAALARSPLPLASIPFATKSSSVTSGIRRGLGSEFARSRVSLLSFSKLEANTFVYFPCGKTISRAVGVAGEEGKQPSGSRS